MHIIIISFSSYDQMRSITELRLHESGMVGGREGRKGGDSECTCVHHMCISGWLLITWKLVYTNAFQGYSMTLASANYILGGEVC